MADILDKIIAWKREEVRLMKEAFPATQLYRRVEEMIQEEKSTPASMSNALTQSSTGIIAEFKRRSPSKGWINEGASPAVVPVEYQKAGAAAVSILTDSKFFGGKNDFIVEARQSGLTLPVLYKNFVIDEYQIFQARLYGASAVLLIAANLTVGECRTLMHTAHDLQMEVLLEMHSEHELSYAELEPDLCGINNRNLGSFVTDVDNSFRMAEKLPPKVCKVSESGISKTEVVKMLREAGYRGFLIGETFMKTDKPGKTLEAFINSLKE